MGITNRKTYAALVQFGTIRERFEYLKLTGIVGKQTFGGDRYLNQALYTSPAWRSFRNRVIIRDNGCDLAMPGYEIISALDGKPLKRRNDYIIIHHINPLTVDDIQNNSPAIFDMNNVVCVSPKTHRAIHYGDDRALPEEYVPRFLNDTCPWKIFLEE